MAPGVSVILPFYNAEKTLSRAVSSVVLGELQEFELLLVDNCSTDTSPDIARKWSERDPRIRFISESRQGVMYASNTGVWNSVARYVARMDADDESMPGRLRLQSEFLDRNPSCGAVGGLVEYCPDLPGREGFRRYVEWCNSVRNYREIRDRCFIESPVINPAAMWRREVFNRHGGYRDGKFPEDYELWLRWLDEGVRVAKIPQVVLRWYDSQTRLTRSDPRYSDEAFFGVKSRYLARWLARYNPFHPSVVIWGASRISRKRSRILEKSGVEVTAYIDIKRTRQLDRKVIYFRDLPPPGKNFILSYVRQWEKRDEVADFLQQRGYREGVDYLLVS